MFGWLSNLFKAPVPVETAQQAQIIGERIAHESFPNIDYSKYRINVDDQQHPTRRDTWCVHYDLLDSNGELASVFGGGGPEIHIRKKDGKILRVTLQR